VAELITMPKLGFDMAEGKLSEWLKKPGEQITQGETILLVETDKATVEVPAFRSGVLLDILVQAGESVPIGTAVAVVGEADEKYDPAALGVEGGQQAAPPAPAAQAPAAPSEDGEEGEDDEEAVETPAEPMTPPPGPAHPGPDAPPLEQAEAAEVPEGTKIADQQAAPSREAMPQPEAVTDDSTRLAASPVAARMAGELGIDLRQVKGSGPGGRIIKRDIEVHVQEREKAPKTPPPPPMPTPSYEPSGADYAVEPLSGLRQTIGKRMVESKQQAPHFYVTMDIDMEAAMTLRSQLNALLPENDKISVNDLIQKAAAVALRQFPKINASWGADGIHVHNAVNIGHAVARENGLVTAVVRDVDRKSLAQIARETRELVTRARDGKMKPDEMVGGTFTLSNLGMFEVDDFIAIINPPQAAILAVGAVQKVPVVNKEGQVVPGTRMKATISADHRVTDGAEAAKFMQAFKKTLEEPMRLVI
jgi:pyruvate dehydrogenase E2 component (dihydrolipoamide acetyltransferase)